MTYITGGAVQLSGTTSLIDLPGISAPSLSASAHGKIYFDSGTNTFRVSQNGSAYSLLQGITQITGDATAGPGSGSQALTLATVNSNVGSFTNASITVNAKGLITAASSGSGATPGGSDTQLQYNSSGTFAGASSLTTDGTRFIMTASSVTQIRLNNTSSAHNWYISVPGSDTTTGPSGFLTFWHQNSFVTALRISNVNPYPVICGSDGYLYQSMGSAGQVLTSNGPGTLPTWGAAGGVNETFANTTAASYNALTETIITANATSNAITVNLPAAASNTGKRYTVIKTDSSANTVTLDANASETISGATTQVLTFQWQSFTIACNGTAWFIL